MYAYTRHFTSHACLASIEQIRFHEHHPEYGDYWSPDTGNDTDTTPTTYDKPNSERLPEQDASDEPRTLQVGGAVQ